MSLKKLKGYTVLSKASLEKINAGSPPDCDGGNIDKNYNCEEPEIRHICPTMG